VVVSVVSRMTFDFVLWSEGQVPVTLVCEEAHRYVPSTPASASSPVGAPLPGSPRRGTQVWRVAVHHHAAAGRDRSDHPVPMQHRVRAAHCPTTATKQIVESAISDTGSGMLEFLSALGQREAIAFGDGVLAACAHPL